MVMIYTSRYTPDLTNGQDLSFNVGEKVIYKNNIDIIIDSELMKHPLSTKGDGTGYECIFRDTGNREFAFRDRIIDWDGKC